jgi:hypothetical protein
MKLSDLASVSGKGGLYKVVAPTKTGVVLESLDKQRAKLVASVNQRISLLHEISVYTTTKEGTTSLEKVLKKIHAEYGNDLGVDAESDAVELKAFLKSVLPEYDESRVYVSDIKKLVKWYAAINEFAAEVLTAEEEKGAA